MSTAAAVEVEAAMVRLTAELVFRSPQRTNCILERELDMRGNKITVIENLGATMDCFDCLDLSDNEVLRLENFPLLVQLRTLLLNNNQVARVAPGLGPKLPHLETLILTNNKISSLSEIDNLSSLTSLREVSLLRNPVTKRQHYRQYVIHRMPFLKVLDFSKIKKSERREAARLFESASGKELEEAVAKAKTFTPGEVVSEDAEPKSAFTPEQMAAITAAIAAASTPAEIDRLEQHLKQVVHGTLCDCVDPVTVILHRQLQRSLDTFQAEWTEAPFLTSPRSLEACLRHGVDPDSLVVKPLSAFSTDAKGIPVDADFAEIRAQRYEERRVLRLKQVRQEYAKIKMEGGADLLTTRVMRKADGGKVAIDESQLEKERADMERMAARQAAELEQMLAHEAHMLEIAKAAAAQAERERQLQLARERELKRKRAAAAEAQAEREAKRKEELAQEEAVRREEARRQFEEAKRRAKEQERQAALRRKEARLKAEEADRKREEFKRQTQAILDEQAAAAARKQAEIEAKEQERLRSKAEEARRLAAEKAERDAKNKARIEAALQAQKDREVLRLAEWHRKEEEKAEALARQQAEAEAERRRLMVESRLKEEERREALERKKRMDEYFKMKTAAKLEDADTRVATVAAQKEAIRQARQEAKKKAAKERAELAVGFEKIKAATASGKPLTSLDLPPQLAASLPALMGSPSSTSKSDTLSSTDAKPTRPNTVSGSRPSPAKPKPTPKKKKPTITTETTSTPPIGKAASSGPPASSPKKNPSRMRAHNKTQDSRMPPVSPVTRPATQGGAKPKSGASRAAAKPKPTPAKSRLAAKPKANGKAPAATPPTPEAVIQELQRTHTLDLMDALQVEKEAEEDREKKLGRALSKKDKARLEHAFSAERRAASERIMRLTEDHERLVAAKRRELGLAE